MGFKPFRVIVMIINRLVTRLLVLFRVAIFVGKVKNREAKDQNAKACSVWLVSLPNPITANREVIISNKGDVMKDQDETESTRKRRYAGN